MAKNQSTRPQERKDSEDICAVCKNLAENWRLNEARNLLDDIDMFDKLDNFKEHFHPPIRCHLCEMFSVEYSNKHKEMIQQ